MVEMRNDKLISVIMPAHNEEKYIGEAIQSVQNQTYKNWELIIVNDASTDHTGKIIEHYSINDMRIKSITFTQNQGACAALNEALKNSEGQYICWLSADDKYEPEMLQSSVDFLANHTNFQAVFSMHSFIDENSNFLSDWKPAESFYNIGMEGCHEPYYTMAYMGNAFNACTVLATSKAFHKAGYFNEAHPYAGDYDFMMRLSAFSNIGFLAKVNVLSRIHSAQVTCEGRNDMDAIHVYEDMIFNEQERKKLFVKAGILDRRLEILATAKVRYNMYKSGNMKAEENELKKILDHISKDLPSFVQADAYCDNVAELVNRQEWDQAQKMLFSVPNGLKNYLDQEKWGIIAATILEYYGQYSDEKNILESILDLNKSNYEAQYMRGHLYENEGDYMNALECYAVATKTSEAQQEDHELMKKNIKRFVAKL